MIIEEEKKSHSNLEEKMYDKMAALLKHNEETARFVPNQNEADNFFRARHAAEGKQHFDHTNEPYELLLLCEKNRRSSICTPAYHQNAIVFLRDKVLLYTSNREQTKEIPDVTWQHQ